MNRREVIAITVIINIILLSVLFFTAHRLDDTYQNEIKLTQAPTASHIVSEIEPLNTVRISGSQQDIPVDEVDTVLRDFAAVVAASQQQSRQPSAESDTLPPTPSKPGSSTTYPIVEVVVKKGDFLQRIARQNHSTVEAIKAANGLVNDQLKVGQVLRVPQIYSAEKPAIPAKIQDSSYRVKSGDSPWKIAKQFNVSVEDLLKLNQMDEDSAKNLKPGDLIKVPL